MTGGYPDGAEYDRNAPFNKDEEVCELCGEVIDDDGNCECFSEDEWEG